LLFAGAPTALAKPARVIVLRHAEKPAEENNVHLSPRGRLRAQAQVRLFSERLGINSTNPPAALFATLPVSQSVSESITKETAAARLG